MEGFTYNGVHSSDMGIIYVPSAQEMGDFFSDYETIESERSWQDGGIYYKTRVKTRTFSISCFYEMISGQMLEAIIRWLDRRTYGELIFDSRPYAIYFVRPTKRIVVNDYLQTDVLHSGTFEIEFSAYHPFAKLSPDNSTDTSNDRLLWETGVLQKTIPLTEKVGNIIYAYNPGTERGHSKVILKSSISNPVTLTNNQNGTKCTIKPITLSDGESLEIDSYTGRTEKVTTTGRTLYPEFHDDGFLMFEPCTPFYRDIPVHLTAESREVTATSDVFDVAMEGQWILIEGAWKFISVVASSKSITINTPATATKNTSACIATRNAVVITSSGSPTIEIKCYPEVR